VIAKIKFGPDAIDFSGLSEELPLSKDIQGMRLHQKNAVPADPKTPHNLI
jgi:hypothetical protein